MERKWETLAVVVSTYGLRVVGAPVVLTRAFKEQLEAAGCSIPFPQTDVHLHQAGAA